MKFATKKFFSPDKKCTGRLKLSSHCRKCHNKIIIQYYQKCYIQYIKWFHEIKINGCAICGYNKCDTALEFHHVNLKDRKFNTNMSCFKGLKIEIFIAEINKCILLCANCHKEIHEKERKVKNMGSCENCRKKIMYNKYIIHDGRVLCNPCNIARLLQETLDKEKAKKERAMKKILKPSKKAKKAAREYGLHVDPDPAEDDIPQTPYTQADVDNEEGKTTEDTR